MIGAVLAGGASRRMGRPKALVAVDGTAMAARAAAALRHGGVHRVTLVGGDPSWGARLDLVHLADRWPGEGPLGGIATAVADAPGAFGLDDGVPAVIVVVACDQPFLTGASIDALIGALGPPENPEGPAIAAARAADGRIQPFPSAWRRALAPALVGLFERGVRRAEAGFDLAPVAPVPLSDDVLGDIDQPTDLPDHDGTVTGLLHSAGPVSPARSPFVDVPEIDIAEAARRVQDGTPVIDVREPDEYVEGHVPGTPLIPLATVPDRIAEVPSDGEVLIICRSGGRSRHAAEFLLGQGIQAVNITGGIVAWIEAGHPVATGEAPGPTR